MTLIISVGRSVQPPVDKVCYECLNKPDLSLGSESVCLVTVNSTKDCKRVIASRPSNVNLQ